MSPDRASPREELAKARAAADAGADTVMDLSIAGDADGLLRRIARASRIPVGSVPIYSAMLDGKKRRKGIADLSEDDFLRALERHAKLSDFVTVHAAITVRGAELAKKRELKVVSRGGCFLAAWMAANKKENPYLSNFDSVLEILKERDVVLSLGDALRPGCIADAGDSAQMLELIVQGKLVKRALKEWVQVICEGPGHMPLSKIEANVRMQKRLCAGVPYYVLGPLVTDVAVGYDHISAAIGGTVAAAAGADFLCVVTPSEHVALPDLADVREGVIAARIAAHSADIIKRMDSKRDLEMSRARWKLDWKKQFELALENGKAKEYRKRRGSKSEACSMCGEYCAYKLSEAALGK
jgi:phosphomethylpyrimidine synthase